MAGKKEGNKKGGKKKEMWVVRLGNRLGLSTVVVTLIIVLIAILAVALLWVPVRNLIVHQTELTAAQSKFFSQQMDVLTVSQDQSTSKVIVTIRRPSGTVVGSSESTTTGEEMDLKVDIFSINDVSGSMRQCYGIDYYTCHDLLRGSYSSGPPQYCYAMPNSSESTCVNPPGTRPKGTWDDKLTAVGGANRVFAASIFSYSTAGDSRIGLIAYNKTAISTVSLDLTADSGAIDRKIQWWNATGSTCVCCAIRNATAKFSYQSPSPDKMRAIIVMSDGVANVDCNGVDGEAIGKAAAISESIAANSTLDTKGNFKIYTVGVGADVDAVTLQAIAAAGQGKYYPVTNLDQLVQVYNDIARQIRETSGSKTVLNFLYLKFFNATDIYQLKETNMPDVLQSKRYDYTFGPGGDVPLSGTITKLEIYPVVMSGSKEVIGPLLSSWQLGYT